MRDSIKSIRRALAALAAIGCAAVGAQQISDPDFNPDIRHPAYETGRGPTVMIDEAHFNYHTADGRYKPFADFLRRDGFRVVAFKGKFDESSLSGGQILVIANALAERTAQDWKLPTPSAFSDTEIRSLRAWVENGGSLFLIVDHMPMPGAAQNLADAFGVEWSNGYALGPKSEGSIVFSRSDGSLRDHPIVNGRNAAERIDTVATFTGSAFRAPRAEPILTFCNGVMSYLTSSAGAFNPDTPKVDVTGWQQGAALRVGKGKIALFGEAAMFTAQLAGADRVPVGMNAPVASQNSQFLLNVLHWLSGALPDSIGVYNGQLEARERPEWGRYFSESDVNGTIVVTDEASGTTSVYAKERAIKEFTPASTFKIPHTLFSLDAGVVRNASQVFPWDGIRRDVESWNRDQTLRSAMGNSVVWVYQGFARQLGEAREREYLRRIDYGNANPAGGIDRFWLAGELKISAFEQVAFLRNLYLNKLPFSPEHQNLTKELMVVETGPDWTLRAKTGWAAGINPQIGWWVGWVEKPAGAVFFALNIDMPRGSGDAPKRQAITRAILASIGTLPVQH